MDSTSIVSVGYDEDDEVLEVEFVEGRVYRYLDVPARRYEELLAADSVGGYVNRRIKPMYEVEATDV